MSIDIEAGEFIGVLGPNGADKTTLMRAVLGLLSPSKGSLKVFGHTPERGNSAIGYLPQLRTVLPDLEYAARFHRELAQWRALGLALIQHRDREHDRGNTQCSRRPRSRRPAAVRDVGGERQRLLLAQSLIGQPKLLLLDEPLISLDARHQEVAIDVVRKVCRERKITVLFSAHELNQLLGHARPRALPRQPSGRARHR